MTAAHYTDPMSALERVRRQRGLRQAELAKALGVTQGHYSKLARGIVPLSSKVHGRTVAWLKEYGGPIEGDDAATVRMKKLASSIRAQCMELMHLSDRVLGSRDT